MTINTRYVSRNEYDKVLEIAREVFSYPDYYYIAMALDTTRTILAEIDNVAVGFVQLYVARRDGLRIGVVYYIGVRKKFQGIGVGKALLEAAEKYFLKRRVDLIAASTRRDNIRAQRLFKSMGYKVYDLYSLVKEYGWDFYYLIVNALYAYEDDVFMIKWIACR